MIFARRFLGGMILMLLCAQGWAAMPTIDPDELPRKEIPLPDGTKVYEIEYQNRRWRLTTADILLTKLVIDNSDVCFEAKFSHLNGKDVVLFQAQGKIICLEEAKLKEFKTLQRMDNIWLCGKLRENKAGTGVEMNLVEVARLPEDLVLCKNRLEALEKRKDANGMMELGARITKILEQALRNFNEHDQFLTLRSKAWFEGLTLMEQQTAPDDVDGLFAIGEKWVDLLRKTQRRNEIVLRILRTDPDHRKASRIARDEMGLVRMPDGKWVTPEERLRLNQESEAEAAKQDAEKRAAMEAKVRLREEAVKERAQILVKYEVAIRTAEGVKELEGAIESLGKAVQSTIDPKFGRQGVDVLASIADPAAVFPGLDLAAKSEFPEVRRDVYATLAWRGGDNALKTLSHALRKESEVGVVKSGVDSLVRRGDRPALETLMDCLQSEDAKVQAEVVEGLKVLARTNLSGKDAWLKWWETNKDKKDLLNKESATP
ncbi:MAG: HEAT repeat domain-containing protein [Planctomycetota bacterium]|nr:HEAT repeat domain-containing protein [Planctomycetota bacterium]